MNYFGRIVLQLAISSFTHLLINKYILNIKYITDCARPGDTTMSKWTKFPAFMWLTFLGVGMGCRINNEGNKKGDREGTI